MNRRTALAFCLLWCLLFWAFVFTVGLGVYWIL